MKKLLLHLAPRLREVGFRGTAQNYRRADDNCLCIVNFQKSTSGDTFYINLGAHPALMANTPEAHSKRLTVWDCFCRCRVGRQWPLTIPETEWGALAAHLRTAQREFFDHVGALPRALATRSAEEVLKAYCIGTTIQDAALQLALAAYAVGRVELARRLAERCLEALGEGGGGVVLRVEARKLLENTRG